MDGAIHNRSFPVTVRTSRHSASVFPLSASLQGGIFTGIKAQILAQAATLTSFGASTG
jgi:hypothetical protein